MRKTLALSLTVLFALACSDATTTAPEGPGSTAPQFAAKNVLQSVTGSGHFESSGEWRTFSVTARRQADGSVKGEWQLKSRTTGAETHGDVLCFTIVGNEVWVGGITERSSFEPIDLTDYEVTFRAIDNGQGATAAPDQIGLMNFWNATGFADLFCQNTPTNVGSPPSNDVEAGNIQIRG